MNTTTALNSSAASPRIAFPRLLRWASVLVVIVTMLYFVALDALPYLFVFESTVYRAYWPVRFWMFAHVGVGTAALLIGAVQICLGLTGRTYILHRWLGRGYVVLVIASGISVAGLLSHGSLIGESFGVMLATIAGISSAYVLLGAVAAYRRDIHAHRAWMIRSYMSMMIFALFRLVIKLPVLEDMPLPERFATLLAVAYFTLLAATEVALQARGSRTRAVAPSS